MDDGGTVPPHMGGGVSLGRAVLPSQPVSGGGCGLISIVPHLLSLLARLLAHAEHVTATTAGLDCQGLPPVPGCHGSKVLEVCPVEEGVGLLGDSGLILVLVEVGVVVGVVMVVEVVGGGGGGVFVNQLHHAEIRKVFSNSCRDETVEIG